MPETITKVIAIKEFFELTSAETMREVKGFLTGDPMTEDREGYEWIAGECARKLGKVLRPSGESSA